MVASWNVLLDMLEGLSRKFAGKKVMLTEVGYCSGPGGGCERKRDATAESRALQALHYEALLTASAGKEAWFLGGFWWNWDADPAVGFGVVDGNRPMPIDG